jgi:transcription initiation factor TFIIH subunit 3
MIAGALTLALSHINRESITYAETLMGTTSTTTGDPMQSNAVSSTNESSTTSLQSRILLISASPSTDLAHQYIPIMNAIFACQRLAIPIDILQLPLPVSLSNTTSSTTNGSDNSPNSTVFLQQAADATHGIFIPARLPTIKTTTSTASTAFLTYLLLALLPSPGTRTAHLILPTRIDVDFRAACFCHRNVVSTGFVCSICLSIFCSVPENGDCLTCGTHLNLGNYGARPVVVARKGAKTRKKQLVGR